MRKIIFTFILVILVLLCPNMLYAYSTNSYSIDIPSSFSKMALNSFSNNEGVNINIQITSIPNSKSYQFTEESLASIIEDLEYDLVYTKEITTATQNSYKCYHIISGISDQEQLYYINQYIFITNNLSYVLTITSIDKNDFEKYQNVVNSFTINSNYTAPEEQHSNTILHDFFNSRPVNLLFSRIILDAISLLGCICIGIFTRKKPDTDITKVESSMPHPDTSEDPELTALISHLENSSTEFSNEQSESSSTSLKIESNDSVSRENVYPQKRYCTNCGKPTEDDWDFCNYCGCELRSNKK